MPQFISPTIDQAEPQRARSVILTSWTLLLLLNLAGAAFAQPVNEDVVAARDTLDISVWGQSNLSGLFVVEADGTIAIPLLGTVQAAGLTLRALEADLTQKLTAGYLTAPQVRVTFNQRAAQVFVLGEVRRPGTYPLSPSLTVLDALALAGSVTERAGPEVSLLREGKVPAAQLDITTAGGLAAARRLSLAASDVVLVAAAPTVHVLGPVKRPGEYAIERDSRVVHILSRAGGLTDADSDPHVTVVRMVDGDKEERRVELDDRVYAGDVLVVAERAPFHVSPTLAVLNAGYDSNIHRDELEQKADGIATLRAGLNATAETPRLSFVGHGLADYLYFQRNRNRRWLNTSAAGRIELRSFRLAPFAAGGFERGLLRDPWEMNLRLLRTVFSTEAGGTLRVTPATGIVLSARRVDVQYGSPDASDAAEEYSLNRYEDRATVGARVALTSETTALMTASVDRVRFQTAAERDSTIIAVSPRFDMGRSARVSGHAAVGYKQVTFDAPALRDFRGVIASIRISRGVSDRIRLTGTADREFTYSAHRPSGYYVLNAVGGGLVYWINRAWQFEMSAGRQWLVYDAFVDGDRRLDRGITAGAKLVRRMAGTMTVEFGAEYQLRQSPRLYEDYDALVIGTSVIYAR